MRTKIYQIYSLMNDEKKSYDSIYHKLTIKELRKDTIVNNALQKLATTLNRAIFIVIS